MQKEASLNDESFISGLTEDDIDSTEITLDDFANAVKFLSFGFAKNKGKEQGAGAAGGGMPGMASRKLENMVKLAHNFDLFGMYSVADRIL